jgi:hypothetical protein
MNQRCTYPDCDCTSPARSPYIECKVTGLRLDYYDDPPTRSRTVGERVRSVVAPGLAVIGLLWRKMTGSGRR